MMGSGDCRLKRVDHKSLSKVRTLAICRLRCAVCVAFCGMLFLPTLCRADPPQPPQVTSVHVGFADRYKVGVWTPVEIAIRGGGAAFSGQVSLIVPDGDGVPSRVSTDSDRPCNIAPGGETTVRLLCRFGRVRGTMTAELRADGQLVAQKRFEASATADAEHFLPGLELRSLVVTIGPSELDVEQAGRLGGSEPDYRPVSARLDDVAHLPTHWCGYEGVDAVMLSTSQPEIFRGLTTDDPRIEALDQWVRMGGRLVLCGGARSDEVLANAGPLHRFVPGRFEGVETLRRAGAIESFCGSRAAVPQADGGKAPLRTARLADVQGKVEASDSGLPLVVRTARGFGQVIFLAVDLDRSPMSNWSDRPLMVAKLLDMPIGGGEADEGAAMMHFGYSDLSGQLRSALDNFVGVQLAPFWLVAGLIIAYLVLIGPVDYFVLRRFAGRMRWTWLTFPLVALLACAGAYVVAVRLKGNEVKITQADVVDVDAASGQVRGTTWLNVFSPRIDAFNLSIRPQLPDGAVAADARSWMAWFGLPGSALGGMNPQTASPAVWTEPYDFSSALDRMLDVPLLTWSTKSFTARWTASTNAFPQVDLTEEDQLLTGAVTNTLGFPLEQCLLAHGSFVYQLGTLAPGESAAIGSMTKRSELKTLLTGWKVVFIKKGENYRQESTPYDRASTDIPYILRTMMFYDAAGGRRYTGLDNDYQRFVDLTALLKADRAILMVQGPIAPQDKFHGATLLRDGQPLDGPQSDHTTMYRFVFPVKKEKSG